MVDDRVRRRKPRSRSARAVDAASDPAVGAAYDHVLYLHEMLQRRVDRELPELMAPLGDPLLRGSHRRILQLIPLDGCRPTDLAGRARMTKQSVGELLAHLEANGYVTTAPDPHDGRAVLVRRTRAGERAAAKTYDAIRGMEDRWRAEVGADRYDEFRAVLVALVAADDDIHPS